MDAGAKLWPEGGKDLRCEIFDEKVRKIFDGMEFIAYIWRCLGGVF